MRFLHTSDLHIGHRLCDRDRLDEHELILDWLLHTAKDQAVDYMILAGDIFDTSVPSNAALKLYYRFLASFPRYGLKGGLIIGGNHDSPSALNAPRDLLEALNIHIRGVISPDPKDDLVMLTGSGGETIACALVPYLRERDIRTPKGGESVEDRDAAIREGISGRFAMVNDTLETSGADASLVLAHLFTAGSETSGGERDLYVGNLGHIAIDALPSASSYTALGHIHRPGEPCPGVRYSGSPLAMDFGDTGEKSVTVFDLPVGIITESVNMEAARPEVRFIPVPCFRRLLRISGTPGEISAQVSGFKDNGAPGLGFWAEVQINSSAPDSYFNQSIEVECAGKGIDVLRIQIIQPENKGETGEAPGISLEDISPYDMFELKCRQRSVEPDDALKLAFGELIASLEREGEEDNAGED